MSDERGGFRGYIASRAVRGTRFPQRVQNLVVRNHAVRHALLYKLSFAEYAMPGCYMMLQTLLDQISRLDGIIVFSMFMLPSRNAERAQLYKRILDGGAELHAALEDVVLRSWTDVPHFEDTIRVAAALRLAPSRGRFIKFCGSLSIDDPFILALKAALRLYDEAQPGIRAAQPVPGTLRLQNANRE